MFFILQHTFHHWCILQYSLHEANSGKGIHAHPPGVHLAVQTPSINLTPRSETSFVLPVTSERPQLLCWTSSPGHAFTFRHNRLHFFVCSVSNIFYCSL